MIDPKFKRTFAITLMLAVLMLATRFHHLGSALHLPDASLAVFFLAGFYLRPAWTFPFYLLEAGLIDHFAITIGGVSDWCVTPAYMFLIPTYGSLWLGGRWYAAQHSMAWRCLIPLCGALFITTSLAFVISNGSFYTLSGRFPEMSWPEYAGRVAKYYPPYVTSAFVYVALAAFLQTVVTALGWPRPRREQTLSL
jgi:hypothetical protein